MTREEAKIRAKLYSALAEGKIIQVKNPNGTWEDIKIEGLVKIYDCTKYRIKPKLKYRPFRNREECWNEMLKHQPVGWLKSKICEESILIGAISDKFKLILATEESLTFSATYLFEIYMFADGTPFGAKEEE